MGNICDVDPDALAYSMGNICDVDPDASTGVFALIYSVTSKQCMYHH